MHAAALQSHPNGYQNPSGDPGGTPPFAGLDFAAGVHLHPEKKFGAQQQQHAIGDRE